MERKMPVALTAVVKIPDCSAPARLRIRMPNKKWHTI